MTIDELAIRTGVSPRALRYYEAKHLLQARRQENGYRDYDETAIKHVQMIQFYLSLGLSTEQILNIVGCKRLLALSTSCFEYHNHTCPEALEQYEHKLAEIEEQIATLQQARGQLQTIVARLKRIVQTATP
ncbi:MAG: MerR family transcriptional regulator [Ktedonobacteraceae bacterium]|nr:MerR family transcriptional regulator [Ktedonobacteraceae bacterium]